MRNSSTSVARATRPMAIGARSRTEELKSASAAAWPVTQVGNGGRSARTSVTTARASSPVGPVAVRRPTATTSARHPAGRVDAGDTGQGAGRAGPVRHLLERGAADDGDGRGRRGRVARGPGPRRRRAGRCRPAAARCPRTSVRSPRAGIAAASSSATTVRTTASGRRCTRRARRQNTPSSEGPPEPRPMRRRALTVQSAGTRVSATSRATRTTETPGGADGLHERCGEHHQPGQRDADGEAGEEHGAAGRSPRCAWSPGAPVRTSATAGRLPARPGAAPHGTG